MEFWAPVECQVLLPFVAAYGSRSQQGFLCSKCCLLSLLCLCLYSHAVTISPSDRRSLKSKRKTWKARDREDALRTKECKKKKKTGGKMNEAEIKWKRTGERCQKKHLRKHRWDKQTEDECVALLCYKPQRMMRQCPYLAFEHMLYSHGSPGSETEANTKDVSILKWHAALSALTKTDES